MAYSVVITNLGEINRAIRLLGPDVQKAARHGLLEAVEPVKRDADRFAMSGLSGMKRARKKPPPWSIQKKGATVHEVYVVPTQRGKRFYRTDGDRARAEKFVHLMYGKSYDPALEKNRPLVVAYVDNWLGRMTREF